MSTLSQGVRRTEGYVYNSLHWAFPMVPLLALMFVWSPAAWTLKVALVALATVAAWAGLVVLHTGFRDSGLLPPSGWDAFRTARLAPVRWVWGASSIGTMALFGSGGWRDLFITVAVPAFCGATLALPLLAHSRVRPFAVGVAAVILAEVGLWALPAADIDEMQLRFSAAYSVGFIAAMFVGFAVMFRNVLETTRELERARETDARLAVAEERLRFSRDLHDVFGRTLSAVALNAELAAVQAERGRPEAAATMREVQAIATAAQEEVRAVVRGYREVDLAAELAGARALLEASDIAVTTLLDGAGDLPGPVARAFAWTVREGATNILRHADAATARFAVGSDASGATLTISNDRPHAATGASGSGLAGLTERLAEVGGTLEHGVAGDRFVVTAHVDAATLSRLAEATHSTEENA